MNRTVFLIGAGATYGDSRATSESKKPPLDRRFFDLASAHHKTATAAVARFFEKHFHYDIFSDHHDRLEGIISMLYSDLYHPDLGPEAFDVFRALVKLYNTRIAETTNKIEPNNRRNLFKLIAPHLDRATSLANLSFITFNQDIHLERTLAKFATYKKYSSYANLLCFPHCYGIKNSETTIPISTTAAQLPRGNPKIAYPRLLKLHGSLNWYSTHNTPNISRSQIFNPKRKIHITSKGLISTQFQLERAKRKVDTFPIIIPPVVHKSSVLHEEIKPLWTAAEAALKKATHIVVCGYSCPTADVESANMIRRAITSNTNLETLSIIDPDPSVVHRYLDLLEIGFISYYKDVTHYLDKS